MRIPLAIAVAALLFLLDSAFAQFGWVTTSQGGGDSRTTTFRPDSYASSFTVSYDFYSIPDSIEVSYGGSILYATGYISGSASIPLTLTSFAPPTVAPALLTIRMNPAGPLQGTAWDYTFRPISANWVLMDIKIIGPAQILSGAPGLFKAVAQFQSIQDGRVEKSERQVLARWAVSPSSVLAREGAAPSIRLPQLAVRAAMVKQNSEATIAATYNEGSNVVSDSAKVQVTASALANNPERENSTDPNDRTDSLAPDSGPVDLATGAERFAKPLLDITGAREFTFGLNYSSTFSEVEDSPVGRGWSHPWSALLEEDGDGVVTVRWSATRTNSYLYVVGDDGAYYVSAEDGASRSTLEREPDGTFSITEPDLTKYVFSSSGRTRSLIRVTNARGQSIEFSQGSRGITQAREPISGARLDFTYGTNGRLTGVRDAASGRQVVLAYSTDGSLLESITDPNGNTVRYGYNTANKLETVTAADGTVIFRNIYDQLGRVIEQDDGLETNQPLRFSYDEKSKPGLIITTMTDRNGGRHLYTHDANYRLLSAIDPLKRKITYAYDARGNRSEITDPLGRVTCLTYDNAGRPVRTVESDGAETVMEYDERGNIVRLVNALGREAVFVYDAKGNSLESTDFAGNKTVRTFDGNSLLLSSTTPLGHRTNYGYTAGRLTTVTNALGEITRMAYDSAGRPDRITDPAGKISTTTYSPIGQVSGQTDPLGHSASIAYDVRNRPISMIDQEDVSTAMVYDANGNLIKTTDALGGETVLEYDGEDRLLKITDPNGNTSTNTYDAAGRLIASADPLGNTTRFSYDAAGNLTRMTDPSGAVTRMTYSAVDLPVTVEDALKRTSRMAYDLLGQAVTVTDPLGRITRVVYDELGRVVQTTDALGSSVGTTFDGDGNLTALRNAGGEETRFVYNQANRQVETVTPTGRQWKTGYDSRGLPVSLQQPSGKTATLVYDAAGRLQSVADSAGTVVMTRDKTGRPLTVTEGGKTLTRTYDALGRMTSFADGDGNRLQYEYDKTGNLTGLIYPDGKKVTYAYDKGDRLVSVTDWATRVTRYTYDANSRLVLTERPNGTRQQRGYDKAGQLMALRETGPGGAVLASYQIKYDKAGQITSEVRSPSSTPMPPALVSMTYDADDRVTSFNGEEVTQDPDGNMTRGPLSSGFADFTYDARNRLVSAGGLTYAYDPENRRISASGSGGATIYVNNPNAALWQVLEIRPPGSSSITYCVHGVGLIYTETSGQPLYHHYDLRGSTVVTTDQSGAVVSEFAYDPYGVRRDVRAANGRVSTPFLFVGQWGVMTDANELCFSRARYYGPRTHRFINADPIGFAGGVNWYAYADASPNIVIDPTGNRGAKVLGDVLNNAVQSFRAGADTYFHHKSEGRTTAEALTLGFSNAKSNFLVGLAPTGKSSVGELVTPVAQAAVQEAVSQLHRREFSWDNFQTVLIDAAKGSIKEFTISKVLNDAPGVGLFITTGGYLKEHAELLRDLYLSDAKEYQISQNWSHNIDLQIKLAQRSAREQMPFLDIKFDDRYPEAMNAALLASEKPPK